MPSEAADNLCLGWVQAERHRQGHWSVSGGQSWGHLFVPVDSPLNNWLI